LIEEDHAEKSGKCFGDDQDGKGGAGIKGSNNKRRRERRKEVKEIWAPRKEYRARKKGT